MDGEVDGHEPAGNGNSVGVIIPGEEDGKCVVVPVEEDHGPFSNDQEERVAELRQFGRGEHESPECRDIVGK